MFRSTLNVESDMILSSTLHLDNGMILMMVGIALAALLSGYLFGFALHHEDPQPESFDVRPWPVYAPQQPQHKTPPPTAEQMQRQREYYQRKIESEEARARRKALQHENVHLELACFNLTKYNDALQAEQVEDRKSLASLRLAVTQAQMNVDSLRIERDAAEEVADTYFDMKEALHKELQTAQAHARASKDREAAAKDECTRLKAEIARLHALADEVPSQPRRVKAYEHGNLLEEAKVKLEDEKQARREVETVLETIMQGKQAAALQAEHSIVLDMTLKYERELAQAAHDHFASAQVYATEMQNSIQRVLVDRQNVVEAHEKLRQELEHAHTRVAAGNLTTDHLRHAIATLEAELTVLKQNPPPSLAPHQAPLGSSRPKSPQDASLESPEPAAVSPPQPLPSAVAPLPFSSLHQSTHAAHTTSGFSHADSPQGEVVASSGSVTRSEEAVCGTSEAAEGVGSSSTGVRDGGGGDDEAAGCAGVHAEIEDGSMVDEDWEHLYSDTGLDATEVAEGGESGGVDVVGGDVVSDANPDHTLDFDPNADIELDLDNCDPDAFLNSFNPDATTTFESDKSDMPGSDPNSTFNPDSDMAILGQNGSSDDLNSTMPDLVLDMANFDENGFTNDPSLDPNGFSNDVNSDMPDFVPNMPNVDENGFLGTPTFDQNDFSNGPNSTAADFGPNLENSNQNDFSNDHNSTMTDFDPTMHSFDENAFVSIFNQHGFYGYQDPGSLMNTDQNGSLGNFTFNMGDFDPNMANVDHNCFFSNQDSALPGCDQNAMSNILNSATADLYPNNMADTDHYMANRHQNVFFNNEDATLQGSHQENFSHDYTNPSQTPPSLQHASATEIPLPEENTSPPPSYGSPTAIAAPVPNGPYFLPSSAFAAQQQQQTSHSHQTPRTAETMPSVPVPVSAADADASLSQEESTGTASSDPDMANIDPALR